ncbi:MAG: atsA 39 [Verrucomicrobiales bacterium]|nr:atsA 39 [Verrucomicrobiales bacterium]
MALACGNFSARAADKPNIILINADDLGYGDLSCYGQKEFSTPNLDRLAQEGVRFTQAYAGDAVCAPSRCSLMTGYHTGHTRVRSNGHRGKKGGILEPQDTTIAAVLKTAGYSTGIFGKWGLGELGNSGAPAKKGFDEFFGFLDHNEAHVYYPEYMWNNSGKVQLGRKFYSHDLIVSNTLDFVRRHKDGPFFIYLAVTIPHAGMEVPADSEQPFLGKYPEKAYTAGRYLYATNHHPLATFAGMVTRLDRDIGRLTALLKELGLDSNTLIIFTSDNGAHNEGGANPEFFNSTGGLRGIKRDLYEGGIRIPMIARWPGHIKPSTVSDQVLAHWDMLPTLAEVAGAKAPTSIDGISMRPALLGKSQRNHEFLYWEFHERGFEQAVRMGDWKAVRHNQQLLELYSFKSDPHEQKNVAAQNPTVVAKIEDYLKTARSDSAEWPIHYKLDKEANRRHEY